MCFSATASFVATAALIPVGLLSVSKALRHQPGQTLPLALLPPLFAGQQALEGMVWLALESGTARPGPDLAALAYLGFAFAVWPLWLPWSALRLSAGRGTRRQRQLQGGMLGLGALLAAGYGCHCCSTPP